MSEAQPRLESLHEAKDVAFSVAGWIPPTAPGMADDEDLALASSVLQAEFGAFFPVELPAWRCLLQHHSAMHLRAIPRFRGRVGSYPLLAFERRSWAVWPWACLRPCPALKPRDRRATRARGTRGSLRRTLVARPALAVAISAPSLLTRRWAKAARTEKRPRSRDAPRVRPPDMCGRFPSLQTGHVSPIIVSGTDQTGTSPLAPKPIQ